MVDFGSLMISKLIVAVLLLSGQSSAPWRPPVSPEQQLKGDEVSIYYSTNIIGEVDPCG